MEKRKKKTHLNKPQTQTTIKHLRHDIKEAKRGIYEDRKLIKKLNG